MDAYRKENKIILWIKTADEELRLEQEFKSFIYIDKSAKKVLDYHKISYRHVKRRNYLRTFNSVLEVEVPINGFEKFIRDLEKETKHRVPLYNADIKPEQMYLYQNDLRPCSAIEIIDKKIIPVEGDEFKLKIITLKVIYNKEIEAIILNNKKIDGNEEYILKEFAKKFTTENPDVIDMDYAFSAMPFLYERLKIYNIDCPLHRWDAEPIIYRGGKSFWSYGQVRYQDYAVRLRGRFLVDTNSFMGTECDAEGIAELVQLSGHLFQQTAGRSFGAVFQNALVREMVRRDILVPYKEKPIDEPISMLDMLKADRAGHTFDPKIGFHKDVAEIDFVSMFPWLIYNHNISADCILKDRPPFENIPNLPIRTSMAYKGLVPYVLKPFIDRRMHYKKNPSAISKQRAMGLKWLLVSCYGYLRFREFKLGIPTAHMAICSFARETLLSVIHLAEERGFEVVHGIVDSLYIRRKNMTEDDVKSFCREVELMTGIPIAFEGIYKWIVFLPSLVDKNRPLPSTYYGVFQNGKIKARGIEVRQRSASKIVQAFQQNCLEYMAKCDEKKEIIGKIKDMCNYLRKVMDNIHKLDQSLLVTAVRVSKTDYAHNIPQKKIVEKLQKKGIKIMPGQFIRYIYQKKGPVLPEEYNGKPDVEQYKKLLVRSLFAILQPFGVTKEQILEYSEYERQTKLDEFGVNIIFRYVPMKREIPEKRGLSEKIIKERMEKNGYIVWKSALINMIRDGVELYPNAYRKYTKLNELLEKHHPGRLEELQYMNHVNHGLPDYICFRNNEFLFVECKLQYESLSGKQKNCIKKLMDKGFTVEVHKLVDCRTKTLHADIDILNGEKRIIEEQAMIKNFKAVA
jgi:DNA polymerase elongation subunit (family B)